MTFLSVQLVVWGLTHIHTEEAPPHTLLFRKLQRPRERERESGKPTPLHSGLLVSQSGAVVADSFDAITHTQTSTQRAYASGYRGFSASSSNGVFSTFTTTHTVGTRDRFATTRKNTLLVGGDGGLSATAGSRICYEGQGRTQPGRPRHAAREMQRTVVSHDVCVCECAHGCVKWLCCAKWLDNDA